MTKPRSSRNLHKVGVAVAITLAIIGASFAAGYMVGVESVPICPFHAVEGDYNS